MKKRLTAFIFVLLLVIIPANCFAFPNEPNGFRNLQWGETMSSVINKGYNLTYIDDFGGGVNYNANLKYNYEYGLPIVYNRFYFTRVNSMYYLEGVQLMFAGYQGTFQNLGNTLTNMYGAATDVNTWKGNNTTIYISEDAYYNTIIVTIYNTYTLNNIVFPAIQNQPTQQQTYTQPREKTIQEQINDAKNLTPQQLLDNPVRVVTPQEFYYRTVQYNLRRGIPEDRAYQMAEDMTMAYEARYNMKFGY